MDEATKKGMPVPVVPVELSSDPLEELRAKTARQAARIGELVTMLEAVDSRAEALTKRIEELEAAEIKANEDFTNARAGLVKEKAELDTELKAVKANNEAKNVDIKALQERVATLEDEVKDKVGSYMGAERRIKALEAELAAAKAEIATQHLRICEMLEAGDGRHIVAELARLRKELEAEKTKTAAMADEVTEAKKEADEARSDRQETASKLAEILNRGFWARVFNTEPEG